MLPSTKHHQASSLLRLTPSLCPYSHCLPDSLILYNVSSVTAAHHSSSSFSILPHFGFLKDCPHMSLHAYSPSVFCCCLIHCCLMLLLPGVGGAREASGLWKEAFNFCFCLVLVSLNISTFIYNIYIIYRVVHTCNL